jgi:hypothetical protein
MALPSSSGFSPLGADSWSFVCFDFFRTVIPRKKAPNPSMKMVSITPTPIPAFAPVLRFGFVVPAVADVAEGLGDSVGEMGVKLALGLFEVGRPILFIGAGSFGG